MRTYDFSPLYRSTVGFDQLFNLLDQTAREAPNWPPYNIERLSEDDYRITMALAGFSPDKIELVQKENTLLVAGHKSAEQQEGAPEVLHRGIATRPFRQTFNLAQHVKVSDARFENGLLIVELKRAVPEALKPRRIEIATGSGATSVGNVTTLEQSKVA